MHQILLFVLLILPNLTLALDEKEFIKLILNKRELFIVNEINYHLKQQNLRVKSKDYLGWNTHLSARYDTDRRQAEKDNTSYDYINNRFAKDKHLSFKTSKNLSGGATLGVGVTRELEIDTYDKYRNLEHYNDRSVNLSEYQTTYDADITIPLLKNNSGGSVKLTYDKSKIDETIAKLQLLEAKENIVEDRLIDFIRTAVNKEKLIIHTKHLEQLNLLLAKEYSENDKQLISNEIVQTNRNIATTKTELENNIAHLNRYIDVALDNIDFDYTTRTVQPDSVAKHLDHNIRDLKLLLLAIEKDKLNLKYYKNQKLPTLNLHFWIESVRKKGNYSYYSYYNEDDSGASLYFEYPLSGNNAKDFAILNAELALSKKQLEHKNIKADILLDVTEFTNRLTTLTQNLKSFITEINNTKLSELEKYITGRGNIRLALDEVDYLYSLWIDYFDEQEEYHSMRIKYNNLLDTLVETNTECKFCLNAKQL